MKKRSIYIVVSILFILCASFFVFFATNAFLTNVLNYMNNFNFPYIFGTIPLLSFAFEITTLIIFVERFFRLDKDYRVVHTKAYSIQLIVHSSIGLICSIIAMVVVKDVFFSNPFPGVLFIFALIHLLIISLMVFYLIYAKKINLLENAKRYKYGFKHVIVTITLSIFTFFALNRFGAFLQSFFYMEYSYFWFTLPFYLSLISPLLMLILLIYNKFKAVSYKKNMLFWCLFLVYNLATGLYVIIVGTNNPLLISLVSAAMPIERLATTPIDAILLYGLNLLLPMVKIVLLIKDKDKISEQ